jgi:hypothetical protein
VRRQLGSRQYHHSRLVTIGYKILFAKSKKKTIIQDGFKILFAKSKQKLTNDSSMITSTRELTLGIEQPSVEVRTIRTASESQCMISTIGEWKRATESEIMCHSRELDSVRQFLSPSSEEDFLWKSRTRQKPHGEKDCHFL